MAGAQMRWPTKPSRLVAQGYRAMKLRMGDVPANDIARTAACAPTTKASTGLEVDEAFLKAHPLIEGPCYV